MKASDLKVGSLYVGNGSNLHMILLSKSFIGSTFLLRWLVLETNKVFVSRRFKDQPVTLTLVSE